ncbi:ATP-grasp domain-containing protein [Actinokineospora sp.]|uniref:ATP-grasp domain-containing protein n=1 Tax=Actinokineospora sp. TaxID=1872133 RepID=UPI003D6A7E96
MGAGRVVFVLGRAPGPRSVLPAVVEGLRERRFTVDCCPVGAAPSLMATADLVVGRSLSPEDAAGLAEWTAAGTRWCSPPPALAAAGDRLVVWRRLCAAGVDVPTGRVVCDAGELTARPAATPMVVKSARGSRGRGVSLVGAGAQVSPEGAGPWLVQERVPGDGWDRKLYVIGSAVVGRLRRWPPLTPADTHGRPLVVTADLAAAASEARAALGLCVCGVDVVSGPRGPVVVDVNGMPGFKGVPGVVGLLVEHLARHLDG